MACAECQDTGRIILAWWQEYDEARGGLVDIVEERPCPQCQGEAEPAEEEDEPDPLWEYLVQKALRLPSLAEVETLLDACDDAEPLSEEFIDRVVAEIKAQQAGSAPRPEG